MNLKIIFAALAGSATLIALAHAAEPIKVGLSGPFTGGSSSMGVSMRDGAKLAVAEINKAGGVLGRPIQLVERDDEAKNELGVQVAQELINKEQVVATLGFINTGVAQAAERFYEEAEIPVINNVATGSILTHQFPDAKKNYVFRTSAADTIQSVMITDEAIKRQRFKHPAILNDSTNYGMLGRGDLEKALAALGVKPVTEEKFNIGDTDMTAQVLKAKEAGADVILTYAIGPELAQIANSHGEARLEGADDRFVDAVDGELHRHRRRERRWRDDAADLHRAAEHAEAQGFHRGLPQGLRRRPHALAGIRRTGL